MPLIILNKKLVQYYLFHKKSQQISSTFNLKVYLEIITLRYVVIDQKFNTYFFDFELIHSQLITATSDQL